MSTILRRQVFAAGAAEALIASICERGAISLQKNAPRVFPVQEQAESFKTTIAATKGAVSLIGEHDNNRTINSATAQGSALLQHAPDVRAMFAATS